ncbi:MAG: sugar phosphate nucleotidyltransferase [Roseburia sp.]|nr:sugar phosphate nucleotidyltransferase [Roseburia sp.]
MKVTALIMAGGRGERFWPRSRADRPKQFIDIMGNGRTMIQLTVDRILPIVRMEDIYIATNESYKELVREQLPDIREENIICEPEGRNTAPCIGLGAAYMLKKNEDAVMLVLASDHLIRYEDSFRSVLREAVEIAQEKRNIVTIGITPDCPETGYGYIKRDSSKRKGKAYGVRRFVEKPDLETATEYLASGEYLWNSGMFVWKASTVMACMEEYLPDIFQGLMLISAHIGTPEEKQVLCREFTAMRAESVDYGIMEKAEDIYVLPGQFGWDDVGSWLAVGRLKEEDEVKNTITGHVVTVDTKDCIIEAQNKLIATVGIENMVIVDTEDVTLIGDKQRMGDIKKLLEKLREGGENIEYL